MKVSKLLTGFAAVLTLVLVCAAAAAAQRQKWWHDEHFRRELGLTDEQSARLEEIFQKTQPKLRQHVTVLDQAKKRLDESIEKDDDATVMTQIGLVETARAELNKTRTLMLLRMRRSLTADQWAKFTALADGREQERSQRRTAHPGRK